MMRERPGGRGTCLLLCVLWLSACGHDSPTTANTEPSAPSITTQPAAQSVVVGATASFSVAASGTAPLSYQWTKNGTPIAGATAATYVTPPVAATDDGATFAVGVSNSAGTATSQAAKLTVSAAPAPPSITTQPADQSIRSGQSATFSVVATGSAPLTYQWRKNGTAIAGATAATYTTPAGTSADNGALFSVVVSNSLGSASSNNAKLTVTAASAGTDVVTYKNDLARTGQNLTEKLLTLANVNSASFGKLRTLATDGKVDGQVLYLSGLSIGGATHNVVYAGTENDSLYAFDADTGAQLWKVSLVPANEKASGPVNCDEITPTIGITGTPVIDRAAGVIYVIALTVSSDDTTYHHRLHALDLASGAERLGGPSEIKATYNTASGAISFDPQQYVEKTGLLLLNGTLYTAWTSHCDNKFYTGWLMGYNASNLQQQTAVLNVAPNSGGVGPSIWMSGGGIAADGSGNIYVITANGAFEETLDGNGFPNMGDFGDSFLKISTSGGLTVVDYFSPYINAYLQGNDLDLGSGGILLLPDMSDSAGSVRHLAVGAGKDGNIYLVDRDSMGHFTSGSNNIWQQLTGALGNQYTNPNGNGGVWGTPAYFHGSVYYCPRGGLLEAFRFSQARLGSTPSSMSAAAFPYPGCSPAVSANGSSNGIVWALMRTTPAVLYAYDASNLAKLLYNSNQAGGARDQLGTPVTFSAPTIADGKVFIQQANGVAVFGLLN